MRRRGIAGSTARGRMRRAHRGPSTKAVAGGAMRGRRRRARRLKGTRGPAESAGKALSEPSSPPISEDGR
eukprot:12336601-Alexandrium_andersonii.AAC.1